MTNLKKFTALSGEQKKLLITTSMLLPIADIALRIYGYRKVQYALARPTAGQKKLATSSAAQLAQAQAIAYCARIAAQRGLYRTNCLRESLVTWWLLQRRGISSVLTIGIAKENDNLRAHAWVEISGIPVIDSEHDQIKFSSIYHSDMMHAGDHHLQ